MTYGWAILVVMAIGVVMWQLGIFNLGGITSTTYTGFSRIKPLLPMVSMNTSGSFLAYFVNGAGGGIIINQPVTATVGGQSCTITPPADEIESAERFFLTGTCPGVSGNAGDPYDIHLTISYNLTYGVSSVTHVDDGKIRGPLE